MDGTEEGGPGSRWVPVPSPEGLGGVDIKQQQNGIWDRFTREDEKQRGQSNGTCPNPAMWR